MFDDKEIDKPIFHYRKKLIYLDDVDIEKSLCLIRLLPNKVIKLDHCV